ncbi:Melanoma-associated antigen 10 [Manis javanica]|nr:Melanoma-associated antigen 10 [Manis javanica]
MEEGLGTSQVPPEGSSFPSIVIHDRAAQLVAFLLLKYVAMESTTKAELLEVLGQDHQDQFPVIFSCVSDCLQLAFGIDVEEGDPSDHSYILVTAQGLTYSGQLTDEQSLPMSSLLLFLLSIILIGGGMAPEEKVWEMLGIIGIFPGREHVNFGDPRELIAQVWVKEQYLDYQQGPEGACPSPTASASVPPTQSDGGSGSPVEVGLGTSQVLSSFPSIVIHDKAAQLVAFLLLKYVAMESTTKAEMLEVLGLDHQDQFPVIFSRVSECLQLAFGIDVEDVDPSDHSYMLVTAPGLTYSGQLSHEESLPKSGLLLFLLTIIFLEGGSVPEAKVWEMLGVMGIFPGRLHVIFGDPSKLIAQVWVREQYLEYLQVPDRDPARFHLLWGRRAHMEIHRVKVLEFMAKVKDCTAIASLTCYD